MSDDELRELLHEMRDEPVPPDSLVRMRAGLAARVAARPWRTWKIAALALVPACLVLLAFLVLWTDEPKNIPMPPLVARVPEPPPITESLPERADRSPVMRRVHRRMQVRKAPEPALIRIETDDPEIVILLTGE